MIDRIAGKYDTLEDFGRAAWFSGFFHGAFLGLGIGALIVLMVVA